MQCAKIYILLFPLDAEPTNKQDMNRPHTSSPASPADSLVDVISYYPLFLSIKNMDVQRYLAAKDEPLPFTPSEL